MKYGYIFTLIAVTFLSKAYASVELGSPQEKAGTYSETYASQGLGRVVASSDGRFVLYEWGRPYLGNPPDARWMAPSSARRLQTFLYKVDLTRPDPTSEYLFYPNASCTYWLGDLSPDNKRAVVFELNHDKREMRIGVWNFEEKEAKAAWFDRPPDQKRFAALTAWISNEVFVYPGADVPFVRASLVSNDTQRCTDCSAAVIQALHESVISTADQVRIIGSQIDSADIPKGASIVAAAANGSLSVFVRDDKEALSLLLKRPGQPADIVFENARTWRQPGFSK